MNIPAENPFAKLVEVSERRQQYLHNWIYERQLDLTLREMIKSDPELANARQETPDPTTLANWPAPAPYDRLVTAGDIRLLPEHATSGTARFCYVAVLQSMAWEGVALIAPFSPYASPASKGEWLTGLQAEPLRVLQLWNTHPVPIAWLSKSWKTESFTVDELAVARQLYSHTLDGSWPPAELRESIGLAIHDLKDPRIAYQNEELALYEPGRAAVFKLQEAWAEQVEFTKSQNFADQMRNWQVPLMAAAAGRSPVITVLTFTSDGAKQELQATREDCDYDHADGFDCRWRISSWQDSEPGLPVFAYENSDLLKSGGSPVAQGFTVGEQGELVVLTGESEEVFEQLKSENLILVVREI